MYQEWPQHLDGVDVLVLGMLSGGVAVLAACSLNSESVLVGAASFVIAVRHGIEQHIPRLLDKWLVNELHVAVNNSKGCRAHKV
jgi:hypothetical protein